MKNYANVKSLLSPIVVAVVLCLFMGATRPEESGSRSTGNRLSKSTGLPVATMLNINRVAAWYAADGEQERVPGSGNSGLFYPRGTSTAIYSAGIMWTGKFNDGFNPVLRANGQSYFNGTKPGRIIGIRTGVAEDVNADDVRIWRIRRDWETVDLRQDAAELNEVGIANVSDGQIQVVRDQYKKDWLEWPARKGAPYYERNGRSGYQPHPDAKKIDPGEVGYDEYDEPGLAGADQVVWYVANDIGVSQPWSCPETGMEQQATIWGYNRTDALGNAIFKRFRLIYKGIAGTTPNAFIDSMYIAQWSDPDLGTYTDDLAGCDTLLSLGYVYNGNRVDLAYADFSLPPPASGYDFLQGPLVRGVAGQDRNRNGIDDAADFAVFDLQRIGPGYINLPMTAFIYFAAGQLVFADPPFTYAGAVMWNRMLRGLSPRGAELITDERGLVTTYMFSGDPARGTGWLDGNVSGQNNGDTRAISGPGDRRILLCSGPFTMALGDTQEFVSAWVGGLGKDRFGSIKVMKFNDASVQLAYNNLFSLPKAPDAPKVRTTALDGEVILEWDFDSVAFTRTEIPVGFGGYLFEGYNVYQLPSAAGDLSNAKLLATFDVPNGVTTILQLSFDENSGEILSLPVQFGTDNGIKRYHKITRDEFRSRPLVNGQNYYFAVTAYSNLPDTIDVTNPLRALESPPVTITVVPEKIRPGLALAYTAGDTIRGITDVVGVNDAQVAPTVYNAAVQYGEDLNRNGRLEPEEDVNGNSVIDPYRYLITFDTSSASATGFNWNVKNAITGKVMYMTALDDGTIEHRVSEAGFLLHIAPPQSGLKSVTDPSGNNFLYSTGGPHTILSLDSTLNGVTGLGANSKRNYEIRFDSIGSFALRIGGGAARAVRVPFSVWDVGRAPSDIAKKVIAAFKDSNNTPTRWNMTATGLRQFGILYRVFEPIIIASVPYPAANDSQQIGNTSPGNPGNLVILAALSQTNQNCAVWHTFIANLTSGDTLPPAVGTAIRFNKFLAIANGDVKQFTLALISVGNVDLAKQAVQDIKVFPNPYYGLNRAETDRVNRFVTFSHLPDKAIIRIFNLAGNLVRTLRKDDPPNSPQFLRWNLQNENGLPVASGIYIAYIDMPDIGTTKTLKIAIIQEQQFLRNY